MAFELKLNPKLIFDVSKKTFPIIYKYINYLNYLFIFVFFTLTIVASILFINASDASLKFLVENNGEKVTFNIGTRFFAWVYKNKMAYNLAISAASFGVLSCSSIILDVSKMILDKTVTKLKLSLYSVSMVLIIIVTIMLFYGFLNTSIPISISYGADKKPTINVIGSGNSLGTHTIPWEEINNNVIHTPHSNNEPQSEFTNNNLSSTNYKIFLGSLISVTIVGNGLLISSKLINEKKLKIIFDGFSKNKNEDNNIVVNDDVIEIKTSYLTFYGKKIALNYFIYFDYIAILLIILFLSLGLMSYMIFFDSAVVERSFLENYIGKTIAATKDIHLNWNIHNISWNNKLAVILGFVSSGIGLFLSLSIIINIVILYKNKLLSKFDIFARIAFSFVFFAISFVTILAYNNSGIVVGVENDKLIIQGPELLEGQRKIFSITTINWSDLNNPASKIEIDESLLKGNYIVILSILISIISFSSILYIIYKIMFFKKNYASKLFNNNKESDNKIIQNVNSI